MFPTSSQHQDPGGDRARGISDILAEHGFDPDGGAGPEEDLSQATTMLGAHVRRAWQAARIAKEHHERTLLDALRQRNGEYDHDVLRAIQEQGGSEIFMMLTQVKCRATESWIMEILFPPGEKPFSVEPTTVPELKPEQHKKIDERVMMEAQKAMAMGLAPTPDQVRQRVEEVEGRVMELRQQFADERASRMQKHIEDVTEEGGWQDELEEFISDFVTYPTAFFKGPILVNKKRLHWAEDQFGEVHPATEKKLVRKYRRVSPFDIYPAPDARNLHDGPLIEVMRWRRKELYDLIGAPGYDEEAIRAVIQEYGDIGHRIRTTHDNERQRLEGREHEDWTSDTVIEGLNFWGEVRGAWLLQWGVPAELIPDLDDDYEANVVMIGPHVIRAALNPHPLGRRPYNCNSFERVNGQIWGKGIPQIISDLQDMCNSAARSLANNMALSSGPMVDLQIDRLADGETVGDFHPWRIFQTTESKHGAGSRPAIQFFQPDSNAKELMEVFRFFSELADEYSGIPPYAQGSTARTGGAADTATGLSMLMDSAARGVKRGIKAIDWVIRQSIQGTFEDIMLYEDMPEIKGDVKIVARASTALANRERQAVRRNELLQTISNPVDQQIVGMLGRRKILEDMFQSYDIDPGEILPTEDELKAMLMQRQQAMAAQEEEEAQGGEGQAKKPKNVQADGSDAGGMQPNQRPQQPQLAGA